MEILSSHKNGNTTVRFLEDGTRITEWEGEKPVFDWPRNIDVKLTDWCNLASICGYCHEMSNKAGKHGDLNKLKEVLTGLPAGTELALGGGDTLSNPEISNFLSWAKAQGYYCNLTINQLHVNKYFEKILFYINQELIKGIGISLRDVNKLNSATTFFAHYPHTVWHLIAGIDHYSVIGELQKHGFKKFLLLGYKDFGNGVDFRSHNNELIEKNIYLWLTQLPRYIGKATISFDNLAIEQLRVRRFFTDSEWETFYQGDDATTSMYIDAVEQKYAPTSRNSNRGGFNEMSLQQYFKQL